MVDVLIVGAGPAGALAALTLVRAGARVLLTDRARFPRPKLCGDTINPGALRILDRAGVKDAIDARGLALDGMALSGPRGVAVRARYGAGIKGRSLTRVVLDDLLIHAAVRAGVQFQDGVRGVAPVHDDRDGRVCGAVLVRGGSSPVRVPASMTIAADGRRSTFALALNLARRVPAPRRWAIGAYYEGVTGLETMGEMHVRSGHYIGVAPVPGGLTNACLVMPGTRGMAEPAAWLDAHVREDAMLRDRFRQARRVGDVAVLGPLATDASAAGAPGLLLAGDAAGFIDPITGDGLTFALRGGEIAAQVTLACLEDPRVEGHVVLARRRALAFGRKQRVNRLLRRVVAAPWAIQAAALSAQVAPGPMRRLIRYAGDV